MKQSLMTRIAGIACAAVLATGALAGCMPQNAGTQQTAERSYLTQVNQTIEDLRERLDGFIDAVSRGDVVSMRTQADNAYQAIDDLSKVEAPDAMKAVQEDYVAGANSLKDALNAYIDLYTEIDAATDAQPFDWSSYDARIASIKELYDEGIGKLQAGDNAATEAGASGSAAGAATAVSDSDTADDIR